MNPDSIEGSHSKRAYVILGATGGIGCEVCRLLAEKKANLVIAARELRKLQRLADELNAFPLSINAVEPRQVEDCVKQAVEQFGRVDGIVNCVGSILLKPAHLTSDEEWDETISLNLRSAFAAVRAAARFMKQGGGSVVLMSSAAARIGLANHEAIAAAKAGVIGLTLSAAATYSPKNIRVNAVAPGLVRTPLTERITSSENALKASQALHPLGRIGEPGDIAEMIVWLLDDRSSWATGQIFGVDGGLATVRSQGGA